MPAWRKALLLATLVLALVFGGGNGAMQAHASGGPGVDVASHCLLHKGKTPSDAQSGHHDCALCVYCAVAQLATPLAGAPHVTSSPSPVRASFARTRIAFVRFSATGGNKARASPLFA